MTNRVRKIFYKKLLEATSRRNRRRAGVFVFLGLTGALYFQCWFGVLSFSMPATSSSQLTIASRQGSCIVRLCTDVSSRVYVLNTQAYMPELRTDHRAVQEVHWLPEFVRAAIPAYEWREGRPVGRLRFPTLANAFYPAISVRAIQCPYWLLLLIPVVTMVVKATLKDRRMRCSRCEHCGYDLRATPQRCPECGTVAGTKRGHWSLLIISKISNDVMTPFPGREQLRRRSSTF